MAAAGVVVFMKEEGEGGVSSWPVTWGGREGKSKADDDDDDVDSFRLAYLCCEQYVVCLPDISSACFMKF